MRYTSFRMKEVLGLIPHVFYDLIGRVAPGAASLLLAIMLFNGDAGSSVMAVVFGPRSAVSIGAVLLCSLLVSYVVGFVLGAIGSVFEDGLVQPTFDAVKKEAPSGEIRIDDIPYIYDFILTENPAAGNRLAKLRAESHMCGGLFVGCVVVATLYVAKQWGLLDRDGALVLASLGLTALAAYVFRGHLRIRAWRLQVNYWLLLRAPSEAPRDTEITVTTPSQTRIEVRPPSDSVRTSEDGQPPTIVRR
jgi:hypothetical protein